MTKRSRMEIQDFHHFVLYYSFVANDYGGYSLILYFDKKYKHLYGPSLIKFGTTYDTEFSPYCIAVKTFKAKEAAHRFSEEILLRSSGFISQTKFKHLARELLYSNL